MVHSSIMACRLLDETSFDKGFLNLFDYFLVDCDGTLWTEDVALPGAAQTINALRQKGKKVLYVTNNSSKSRETYVKKLNDLGFEAKMEEIFPTSYCLAIYLQSLKFDKHVYVLGCKGIPEELIKVGITSLPIGPDPLPEGDYFSKNLLDLRFDPEVKAVAVAYDPHVSYVKLVKAATYLADPSCLFIATNEDERFPPCGNFVLPGTGCFVAAIATSTGRTPIVLGKPHRYLLDCIKNTYPNFEPSKAIMIGDRLDSDILFGRQNGLKTLFVLTGISTLEDVEERKTSPEEKKKLTVPDFYLPSVSDLGKLIGS